jgi:hypothetical protein
MKTTHLTSNAPVLVKFDKIDTYYYLFEDLYDNGQRDCHNLTLKIVNGNL